MFEMHICLNHEVDTANKILICEAMGSTSDPIELEHILKTIVKLAGKSQLSNVVFDVTQLDIECSSVDISTMLNDVKELGLLEDIRIARVTNPGQYKQNLVGELAKKLDLTIRNFETRSEALLWLLFNVSEKS